MRRKLPLRLCLALLCLPLVFVSCGRGRESATTPSGGELSDTPVATTPAVTGSATAITPTTTDPTANHTGENTFTDPEGENLMTLTLLIGDRCLPVMPADTRAAARLCEKLREGALTLSLHDYGGWEKVGDLGFALPADDLPMTAEPGDLMLYQGDQIVLFYGTNSWRYTPLGRIDGMTKEDLAALLGAGDLTVTLTLS